MNGRIDPREIEDRAAKVRQARVSALQRGFVAPSMEELTAALGDEFGVDDDARRRAAKGTRKAKTEGARDRKGRIR